MNLQTIQNRIIEIRGCKVMLDVDLATLYEVETRVLNQAVRRNIDLFPGDFMFQLTLEEWECMSSQSVMTYSQKRPKSAPPLVFTEHGVTMLATILKSKKAREMSINIVRVFIALRQFIMDYRDLSEQLKALEIRYNQQFSDVYEVINYLIHKEKQQTEQGERKRIGFRKE